MAFIVILTISVILNIGLIWISFNLYHKNSQLEEVVKSMDKMEEDILKYHQVILGLLTNAYTEFVRIDKRGSFSSDDEVGWSFKLLKDLIKDVTEKMKLISGDEGKE